MKNENNNFFKIGFEKEFKIELGSILVELQEKLYSLTKDLLIDHDKNLTIEERIKLPFKEIPDNKFWSMIMNNINNCQEFNDLICSQSIVNAFKKIFSDPVKFDICTFRARIPSQTRAVYNWHQDEGTWFLSKNKNLQKKYAATLWLSVNGSNKKNSIQIIKNSHLQKLYTHSFVEGQGYFNAEIKNKIDEKDIYTVETKISEGVLFHPLTLHRSVVNFSNIPDMYPRYSIDIRYHDKNLKLDYDTDLKFKIKKIFK